MAVYFFNLHECGTIIEDLDGQDHPDLEAARSAAIRGARGLMAGEVLDGKLCLSCAIVIQDANHAEVARVRFNEAIKLSGA